MNIWISIVALAIIQSNLVNARRIHLSRRGPDYSQKLSDGEVDEPNFNKRYEELGLTKRGDQRGAEVDEPNFNNRYEEQEVIKRRGGWGGGFEDMGSEAIRRIEEDEKSHEEVRNNQRRNPTHRRNLCKRVCKRSGDARLCKRVC